MRPLRAVPRRLHLLVLAVPLFLLTGCGVPGWIRKVPQEKGAIYAIGTGDPGYWYPREEAAVDSAQEEIGRTIRLRVSSVLLVQSQGSRTYAEEVSEEFTQTVVEGATIEEKWLDEEGLLGVPRRLFILMRFSREDFVEGLKKTAEKKKEAAEKKEEKVPKVDIEKVASLAFEELDRAIEEKNHQYRRQTE